MDDLEILGGGDPVEVWKAVEGEPAELIALLRSERPLYRVDREALADWLEGSLKPVKRERGRPRKSENWPASWEWVIREFYFGHDPETEIGLAAFRFERAWRFIKKKKWNKSLGWTSEKLKAAVATRQEIDLDTFLNYLNRPKRKPKKRPAFGPEAELDRRRIIARKIREAADDDTTQK